MSKTSAGWEGSQEVELPIEEEPGSTWGSDVVAKLLRQLGIKFVAINPGSSFRGLHDSLVNYLGNRNPQILLCLHEEHAVAIAHGYAKVTGEPMAVVLHANVGLMHGSMAIFNAWCDRVPMLVLGATGPLDASKRRPWIDWVHTSRDLGALVRGYIKWDDQPTSVDATVEAILRAHQITQTAPKGPTYVAIDVAVQEQQIEAQLSLPNPARFRPPLSASPPFEGIKTAASILRSAKKPVILVGRVSRNPSDWRRRVAIAEALGATVVTDLKLGAAFPTDHPAHRGSPGYFLDTVSLNAIGEADVILSLDWVDLGGALHSASATSATVIQTSLDYQLHNGAGMEYQALPACDINFSCDPDIALASIADELGIGKGQDLPDVPVQRHAWERQPCDGLDMASLSYSIAAGFEGEKICFVRLPLGWIGKSWHFRHPLDYVGMDGGAGVGSGPGMLIGAAVALRTEQRLAVAVLGDGDFMMSSSSFWTAAHYRVPLVCIVANNQSFFNDEVHQERVAATRGRPAENKWIGQRIADPDIDIAAIARAQGLRGLGPCYTVGELTEAIREAAQLAKKGLSVVIDARVHPVYSEEMADALTREN